MRERALLLGTRTVGRTEAVDAARTSPLERKQWWLLALWLIPMLPIILLASAGPAMMSSSGMPGWLMAIIVVPLGLVPAPVTAFVARRTVGRQLAERFLNARFCPSCGYDLATIHPQQDGCTCCPECGGAWRIPSTAPPVASAG
ncbi:MAG: hypothetical protein ACT4PL_08100 [Phycisphaerales bacterium]